MGNRCVITTADVNKSNKDEKLGVYLHWHGSPEQVEEILQECKEKGIRTPSVDYSYFFARFTQIAANYITGDSDNYETSIGIDIVSRLDCKNWDNGVYYIDDNLEIVKQTDGSELEDE